MNKNGYTHNDLHHYNIGIKKTKNKYIKILGKKIPTYGKIIKILDYGAVLHKKYDLNQKNTLIGLYESKILEVGKVIEIRI
jgi:hypothetical protein